MTHADSRSRRWYAAVSVWILSVGACAIALGVLALTRDLPIPESWGFPGASEAFAITSATVGAIVAIRRPDNANGWLFCAIGALFATQALIDEYVVASTFAVAGGLPWTTGLAWTLTWLWAPSLGVALIFLPLVFPNGALLSPRWRGAVVFGVVALGAFAAALAVQPGPIEQARFIDNPLGADVDMATYAGAVLGPTWVPLQAAILLSLGSLVLRFRRSDQDARRQIKWFALAALVAGTMFGTYLAVSFSRGSPTVIKLMEVLVVGGLLGVPTAAGLAILRYRLYDIDRLVSRTISYGLITALLVGLFVVVNLALQSVLSTVTSSNAWAVAGTTLLVAAMFTPVRRRVQGAVDRRFNRAHFDAERIAVAFSDRLRNETDVARVAGDLASTATATVAPTSLTIWLRGGGR